MNDYKYKATGLIGEVFEEKEVRFDVVQNDDVEQLYARFSADCGPNYTVSFISRDDDNDVAVRVYRLISHIPTDRRTRLLEACNYLNNKIRFVKFCLDQEGDVNIEFDIPAKCSDDCVGEIAFEFIIRIMKILESEYKVLMKALYSDEPFEDKASAD